MTESDAAAPRRGPGRLIRGVRAGDRRSVVRRVELQGGVRMRVTSDAFPDGGEIPIAAAGRGLGADRSPQLAWRGAPAATRQYLLVVEDVDVPLPRPIVHTVALIDATVDELAEGELVAGPAIRFVRASFGRKGYHGPRPVPGHGVHHYGFDVYALDARIDDAASLADVLAAAAGHVIGHGRLVGTMER